jgi:glycosyltransferase involved in cell wall biosynthesis
LSLDNTRPKAIGLCMIVKNEADVIERCLDSAKPLVDYVLIEDTGSTDGTQQIIRQYLAKEGIPGEVFDAPWQDFATNRNIVLAALRTKPEIDYALMIDADDPLVYEPNFDLASFKRSLTKDLYQVRIWHPPVTYYRWQLFRNSLKVSYRGVLHEVVDGPKASWSTGTIDDFYMHYGQNGARNQDPKKYDRDAAVLEEALKRERDPLLIARYTFYLGRSYRDAGMKEAALLCFEKRAQLGLWKEEVFVSLWDSARLKEQLGYPEPEVVGTYLAAYEAFPSRAESLHDAMRFCRTKKKHNQSYLIGKHALTIPEPRAGLFLKPWVYQYGLFDELAVAAYWCGRYEEAADLSARVLREGKAPESIRARIQKNLKFAQAKLEARLTAPAKA